MGKAREISDPSYFNLDVQRNNKKFNSTLRHVTGQSNPTFNQQGNTQINSFFSRTGDIMTGTLSHTALMSTISGGVLTVDLTGTYTLTDGATPVAGYTSNRIFVIGQGATADDLVTISNPTHNQFSTLYLSSAALGTITVKNTGNIITTNGTDLVMDNTNKCFIFVWNELTQKWCQVPDSTVGGGGGTSFVGFAADADLNMNGNDILGVDTLDFDGATANIQGLNTLTYWHSNGGVYNNIISINTVGLRYYVGSGWEHQFYVAATPVMRMGTSAIEMEKGVDMNDNSIVQVNKIEFSNSASDYIDSTASGIEHHVSSIDEHFFYVGGDRIMTVDHGEVLFSEPINIDTTVTGNGINMDNTGIGEISTLSFNTSGQILSTSTTEILYQVPSGDKHGFYVAASKVVDITDAGIVLNNNQIINFGSNGISVSASSGALTLPANPLGFINAKIGVTNIRIPYYNT